MTAVIPHQTMAVQRCPRQANQAEMSAVSKGNIIIMEMRPMRISDSNLGWVQMDSQSALAAGAEEGVSLPDDLLTNGTGAARAGLAGTAVGIELLGEVAGLAVATDEVF